MNRVPGDSGERGPRATATARSTRTSSSPEAALRRGVPSSAMSVKSCSPGAMGGSGGEAEELGFRASKASGCARFGDSFGRV
jgi:hypothetical protein